MHGGSLKATLAGVALISGAVGAGSVALATAGGSPGCAGQGSRSVTLNIGQKTVLAQRSVVASSISSPRGGQRYAVLTVGQGPGKIGTMGIQVPVAGALDQAVTNWDLQWLSSGLETVTVPTSVYATNGYSITGFQLCVKQPTPPAGLPAGDRFTKFIGLAPFAYTHGQCKVTYNGDWYEMGTNITYRRVPTPCINLIAGTGLISPKNANREVAGPSAETWGSPPHARAFTDKIWLKEARLANGDWDISWGTSAGVPVEWLVAAVDTPRDPNTFISARPRHLIWHPYTSFGQQHTRPDFTVYANDTSAPPGPPWSGDVLAPAPNNR